MNQKMKERNENRLKLKERRGITLIALVITIIILIILAGIGINLALGNNGIINKAKSARDNYMLAANEEQSLLDGIDIDELVKGNSEYKYELGMNIEQLKTNGATYLYVYPTMNGNEITSCYGVWAKKQLKGKNEDELEKIFIENWNYYVKNYDESERICKDMNEWLTYQEYTSMKNFLDEEGYDSLEDAIVGGYWTEKIQDYINMQDYDNMQNKIITIGCTNKEEKIMECNEDNENVVLYGIFEITESGNYTITVKDEKGKTKSQNVNVDVTKDIKITYNEDLKKLKAGDYVKYENNMNYEKNMYRVLYDASSEYGLQIISIEQYSTITLGETNNEEKTKSDYNNAIKILNNEVMKFVNPIYAIDGRCVGSNPLDKNKENTETVKFNNGTVDSGLKGEDENYLIDDETLENIGINLQDAVYASRRIEHLANYGEDCMDFRIANKYYYMMRLNYNDENYYIGRTEEVVPCIKLRGDIHIAGGDGKSKSTAYVLAK